MKKFISIMLVLALSVTCLVSFVACKQGDKDSVKVIAVPLTVEEYAYGVNKNDPQLLADVNTALAKFKTNGVMDGIMAKYFGDKGNTIVGIESKVYDSKKSQLVIATNAQFPPFEYKLGNKFVGVDMEVGKALADELGMEFVVSDMDFNSVVPSVGVNGVDMAMAALTINDERKASVNFSSSYYNASQMIIVKAGDTTFDGLTTVAEIEAKLKTLKDKKAGFQSGTTAEFYIKGDAGWGFAGFSNIKPMGYDSGALAVQDMINGNIDLIIIDEQPAKNIAKSFNA
ncbi:MAG: transporter substrate-binding domain-containing protein [Clostridia bacterium]